MPGNFHHRLLGTAAVYIAAAPGPDTIVSGRGGRAMNWSRFSNVRIDSLGLANVEVLVESGGDYTGLVRLFHEFRESLKVDVVDGVPDYSAAAMESKHRGLAGLQDRLSRLDISDWTIEQKIDYHVVRAEMNGVDFDHRVLRPWARDPGFYHIIDGIFPRLLVHHTRMLTGWPLENPTVPIPADELAEFRMKLCAIPRLFEQAKGNLTEAAEDLTTIAIRVKEKEESFLRGIIDQMAEHHPEIVPDAERALAASRSFRDWLIEHKHQMTAPAGIGKDNYDWWLKNVMLLPYTWDECYTLIQHEYFRAVSFLKLEEHKNRELPDLELTSSEAENLHRQEEAAQELMEFLRKGEIVTVPEELGPLPPEHYPRTWGMSAYLRPGYSGFFEQCLDREPMSYIAHCFFGHYYVRGRTIWYQDGDDRPIRGTLRLFDMHEARSEALAFAAEEMLMQTGLLDNRARAKEIDYIWMAFRTARALSDLKLHSNEYSLTDAIQKSTDLLPYPWADKDGDAIWWDMEETLRAPGHSTFYVVGKSLILQLLAERSQQLGARFSLREFLDEFMRGGIVPISLTRWEMTGLDDQIRELMQC